MSDDLIPGPTDWAGYEDDLDVKYAHGLFYGKTKSEVLEYFATNDIVCSDRADELLYAPRGAFQYYVFAFADFVLSDAAIGNPNTASPFLNLLLHREEQDPGSVREVYSRLAPVVAFVTENQERFDADLEIYGNFRDIGERIRQACDAK